MNFVIIFYGAVAGLSTLLGIYLMLKNEELAIKNSHYVNSFAAGLILGLAIFHLLPESFELTDVASYGIFFGFFAFFVLENLFILHSGSEIHFLGLTTSQEKTNSVTDHEQHKGILAFTGLLFHSFIDGMIIGIGFEISLLVGLLSVMSVISHEIPEGITSFSLMIANNINKRTAMRLSVAVALATPLGTIITQLFIESLNENIIGILLALAAGTYLYISASDLIPETHDADSNRYLNLLTFVVGVSFIILLGFIFE